MDNIVYLRNRMMGTVDFDGKIRMLSEEEKNEFFEKKFKRENRIGWIILLLLFSLPNAMADCGIWIRDTTNAYFKKSPIQINYYMNKTTKNLNKKEIKIRATIPDEINTTEIKDPYIANLLENSNYDFDVFFNGTTRPLRQGITIFFVDQKTWDGEKACSWNKSGGCNIQDGKQNIIIIPLSQNIEKDLRTLNHERTHAYFLNEPEVVAHLVENLFDNRLDLSQRNFNLYKDEQGKLRF